MNTQFIGNDHTKQIRLNLLPHIQVARGMLRVRIDWITVDDSGDMSFNSSEYNADNGPGLDIIVGRDVHKITFWVRRHNSFPSGPTVNFHSDIRIDRLILLNLAVKLLDKVI